jgi:hypothetical protein
MFIFYFKHFFQVTDLSLTNRLSVITQKKIVKLFKGELNTQTYLKTGK